jgi:argininosuccinate lyase
LAHYLVALTNAFERDCVRLRNAYGNTNLCPLGAAALATTGFPIDRYRTAELLGFDGLIRNSYDAVASRDFIPETVGALAIFMSNISRFMEDLIIHNTFEFSTIKISEQYASGSSIMPQKRFNPLALEHCRGKAGHIIGDLTAILTIMKGIPFSHCRDTAGELNQALWHAIDQTMGVMRVVAGVVSSFDVNAELMLKRAAEGFSTVTDLADTLVRDWGFPFRVAYEIVKQTVADASHRGLDARGITSDMLDAAALRVVGKPLKMCQEEIRRILHPRENLSIRTVVGGPEPNEVRKMIDASWKSVEGEEAMLAKRRQRLEEACGKLKVAQEILLRPDNRPKDVSS